jgi:hypothetical protein
MCVWDAGLREQACELRMGKLVVSMRGHIQGLYWGERVQTRI